MTRAIKNIFTYSENRMLSVKVFMGLTMILAFVYISSLYSIISNTVALQSVEKTISTLNSEVESLDSEYLQLSSKVTPDTLKTFGLKQEKVSFFISRASMRESVALVGHEF